MKALVVYESMFGNTRRLAEAIAEGLRVGADVEICPVAAAPPEPDPAYHLVVVGGPTHAFSMSRASTRADAVRQGADGEPAVGIREWLDGLPAYGRSTRLATFDSRVSKVRHLPGSAAKSAAKAARRHGFGHTEPPESFYVEDVAGPLLPGELDRARQWGSDLVEKAALV